MSEIRKVVRREPEMYTAEKFPNGRIDHSLGYPQFITVWQVTNGDAETATYLKVLTDEDFTTTFIDADQYEAEQRDKVIRELMDLDVSVEPTERIDGTFYIWDNQNESAYDTIHDWLKSQLTTETESD